MLIKNDARHWELEDGRELHSGSVVEVLLYGQWRPARVEYFHDERAYFLYLFDQGEVVGFLLITEHTQIRFPER